MSLNILILAFGRQFKTVAQKKLYFKEIAIVEISSYILSLISAYYLAKKGYGVYALVYSALVQFIGSNLYFFFKGILTKSISFHFSYKETIPFLKIGVYQVGGQVANYFNRDIDVLIIGKLLGTEVLGGYSLAKQLVFKPMQFINPVLTRVASPMMARLQTQKIELKNKYLQLIRIITNITIPTYLLILVFSGFIVKVLYGINFVEISPLVKILSLYMIIRSIGNPIGVLSISTGRTDLEFYMNIIMLIIYPCAILIGSLISINSVAWSILITSIISFIPIWYFILRKMIPLGFKEYIAAILKIK
jgi:PST family polysaccharide transporter/teichuronic acid exporter